MVRSGGGEEDGGFVREIIGGGRCVVWAEAERGMARMGVTGFVRQGLLWMMAGGTVKEQGLGIFCRY